MESFFDLRESLIAALRRLKMIIAITFVFALCGALVRFVPLARQYLTYDASVNEVISSPFLSEEEQPYYYKARRTLYIPPIPTILGETYNDNANLVVNSFAPLKNSTDILQVLVSEFFEEAKQDDAALKEKMVACNYRTRLVFNEEYKLTNFYSQLSVENTDHMVHIYFVSGDPEFSTRVVERAEQLLTDYVARMIMPFSYKASDGQVEFSLPSPTVGLTPKVENSLTRKSVEGSKPALSTVIRQGIKGGAIGAVVGFGLSIILVFFFQAVNSTVQTRQEIEALGARVLTVVKNKKRRHLLSFIGKWISHIESNELVVSSSDESYRIIKEKISLDYLDTTMSILLTGSLPKKMWASYAEGFQESVGESGIEACSAPCVITHAATIKQSQDVDGIILVECFDKSSVADIKRELSEFSELNRPVLGVVLLS